MLRPARLLLILGLCLLVGGIGIVRIALAESPGGVFELKTRLEPAADCRLAVEVDRESNAGVAVQFGELHCPGRPHEPALRVGEKWFALPERERGSRYNTVRRTEDDAHWLVVGNSDLFRSDDGGKTFSQLKPPGWREGSTLQAVLVTGEGLEILRFEAEIALSRVDRMLLAAKSDAADDSFFRERAKRIKEAWSPTPSMIRVDQLDTRDGGKTWERVERRAAALGGGLGSMRAWPTPPGGW